MKRYEFRQNNSHGFFVQPEWTGPEALGGIFDSNPLNEWPRQDITPDVWVMAENEAQANKLAQKFAGVYFDGHLEGGADCPCCGPRWWFAQEAE